MINSSTERNGLLKMVLIFSLFIWILIASSTFAIIGEINFSNSSLDEVMKYISQVEKLNIAYPSDLSTLKVSVNLRNVDVETVLRLILIPYHINYQKIDEQTYVLFRENSNRIPKFSSEYEPKYLSPQKLSEILNELGIYACLAQNKLIFFFNNDEQYKETLSKIKTLDVEGKKEFLLYSISYISKENFKLSAPTNIEYKEILTSFLKSRNISTNVKSVMSGFITFSFPELTNIENDSSKIAGLKIGEDIYINIVDESSGVILSIRTDTDELSIPYDSIDLNSEFMFESSTTVYYLKLWKNAMNDSLSTFNDKVLNSTESSINVLVNSDKTRKTITLDYIGSQTKLQFANQINTFLVAATSTSYTQFFIDYVELGTNIMDGFGVGFRYDFTDSSFSIFGMDDMHFEPFFVSLRAYYNFGSTNPSPFRFESILGLSLSLDRYDIDTSIELTTQELVIFHLLFKGTVNDQVYGMGISVSSKGEIGLLLTFGWK